MGPQMTTTAANHGAPGDVDRTNQVLATDTQQQL